jgi:hypothetical protein
MIILSFLIFLHLCSQMEIELSDEEKRIRSFRFYDRFGCLRNIIIETVSILVGKVTR